MEGGKGGGEEEEEGGGQSLPKAAETDTCHKCP